MEFRIFFPIVDSLSNVKEVDIFALIGKKKGFVEERIDDYYQIKDINFGFKLRDTNRFPQVELKIRTHNFTFKEGDGKNLNWLQINKRN
jgi:hypothetical protein